MASRLLGMVRDILMADVIGGKTLMSAWVLAFTIPNVFRRLLGEGALGAALVPLMSRDLIDGREGKELARRRFATLFASLGALLAVISMAIAGISLALAPFVKLERFKLILEILPIVAPYALFACLSGVAGAALNSLRKFTLPALTASLLNVFLIAALLLAGKLGFEGVSALRLLAFAALGAGGAQLLAMLLLLRSAGTPLVAGNGVAKTLALLAKDMKTGLGKEVWRLAVPGMIGAGALQISFLIDRGLAIALGDYAAAALYYSDRIVFLSVGILAVGMGGVILPDISRSAGSDNPKKAAETIIFALRQILFLCVPAAFFTFFFGHGVVDLLFTRGAFDGDALDEVVWALSFYAWGIPLFSTSKILVAGFYAHKEMRKPVKIAALCVGVNIILNLILMWPLKQGGIALATVASSLLGNLLLALFLRKLLPEIKFSKIAIPAFRAATAAAIATAAAYYASPHLKTIADKLTANLPVHGAETIPAAFIFAVAYFSATTIMAAKEPKEWLAIFHGGKNTPGKI